MKVFYLPLESYEDRYTLQLKDWTTSKFEQRGVEFEVIEGDTSLAGIGIQTGIVLDAHGRSLYALTQLANLVRLMQAGKVTSEDIIYNQDYFHPGWSAIPYILDQSPDKLKPRVYSHLLAQSIDPNDFTFVMRDWMRRYELMVDETITGTFVASTVMVDMMRAALFKSDIHVVGLPFGIDEVRSRVPVIEKWSNRPKRIVFTSRWDEEKQPWFYMDLIEQVQDDARFDGWEFAICTGAATLKSNNNDYVIRAKQMQNDGLLTIYEGLKKSEYYDILANSRVQFNCALQDFVSNTLNESGALGTITLAPAYLSFPEALFNNEAQLYIPWSINDAIERLANIFENPPLKDVAKPAEYHDLTLDRVIDVFESC